jgi:tetratricopeptide (TPR) repeat protein
LAGVTFAVFLPSLQNGFISWDDNLIVTVNPQVVNWSWENTKNIFASFHYGLYHPLVILSFAAEHLFFGFNPFVYHLNNLLLHVLNSVLVFSIILMLGGNLMTALVTALLFGIHPTRVESVAWIMERKDVLYTLFFLGAMIFYLRKNLAVSLWLFFLSLLSKAMAISLPFVLLLCDYLQGRKIDREALKEKIPFFTLAAVFGVLAILARLFSGELTKDPAFSMNNVFIGSYRLVFYYLARIFLPFYDAALYPYGSYSMKFFSRLPLIFWTSPALVLILIILFILRARKNRVVIFGGLFFLVTIFPALFMVSIGPFADRFTYVPSIGIFFLAGMAASLLYRRSSKVYRTCLVVLVVLVFPLLSYQAWQRCQIWKDSASLYDAVCKKYPSAAEAYNSRGLAYYEKKDFARALNDFEKALKIDPRNPGIYVNLGILYFDLGDDAGALANYNRAIQIDARCADAYNNRGNVYGRSGKYLKALDDYNRALSIKLNDRAARLNRETVLNALQNSGRIRP